MAQVKQAIIDVEEEVMSIVQGTTTPSLPEVQTILFKKYFHKADTGYFLDENVVIKAYNKAVYEKENDEEYDEYRN
jgi:hypothetical protein